MQTLPTTWAVRRAALSAILLACAGQGFTQTGEIEEVVVTGSYIKGTPEDAASPVDVTTREDMDLAGNPSLVELIRRTPSITGVDGEQNQFQSNGLEAVSNINLRGLGPGRTLVLLNGTRMVPTPFPVPETGQQFVNTNAIPMIALDSVELLKDGASSTYGSDAIAGVANFKTRSDFRGIEIQGSFKSIDDSEDDGDWDIGAIIGLGTDRLDLVASAALQRRTRVAVRDRDWALRSIDDNPRGGFSSIGSPGTYIPITDQSPSDLSDLGFIAEPACQQVGGHQTGGSASDLCRFRFTDFDNLAEKEEHWQTFIEATFEINESHSLHGEFLFAHDETPRWNTSPSFPPQALTGLDRVVVPGMPHFDDFLARNQNLTALNGESLEDGIYVWGRFQGVSGPAQVGSRDYDTWRLSLGADGTLGGSVDYAFDLSYSASEIDIFTNDSRVDNVAYAYRGLGGPDCDVNSGTPGSGNLGAGDCWYFNPFTSGYTASQSATADGSTPPGSGNSQLNNPDFMADYLTEFLGGTTETELFVADLIFSGESGVVAGGGAVGWAVGFQYRRDEFTDKPLGSTNVLEEPCAFGLNAAGEEFTIPEIDLGNGNSVPAFTYTCSGTGAFHFLAAGEPSADDQDVFAAFAEVAIPFTENFDLQLAVRFEDYGGAVGETIDPKVAGRWQVTDALALRGSITSSFRAPSLNQLSGVGTSLQFVGPTGAFKAIDTSGNPDVAPESAITTNFGVILTPTDNIYVSLDYWNFKFKDTLVLENFGDVVANCSDTTSPINDLACSKITFQDPANPVLSGIQRVSVTYQNGPDLETDGIDWSASWDIPAGAGVFTLGAAGTWINSYDIDAWIWADGFDAVGDLNRFESFARPLPEVKNNLYVNWNLGEHNLRLEHWFTAEYDDKTQPADADWSIDDHHTFDIHYNFRFMDDNARIFASVYNLTDEDPPFARLDLNYDPYTHNAFGRMFKLGVQWRFTGGPFQ
jgi:outer membrane receptor protein involved in Fe transport